MFVLVIVIVVVAVRGDVLVEQLQKNDQFFTKNNKKPKTWKTQQKHIFSLFFRSSVHNIHLISSTITQSPYFLETDNMY